MPDFDFGDALGNLEGKKKMGLGTVGHGALEDEPRAGLLRTGRAGGKHENRGNSGEM